MEIREDGYCFVCGDRNPIGLKTQFTLDRGERRAECEISLPKEFQGWENVVHGGILSTLLDEAAIYACRTIGERFVTAEISVRYRRPVSVERPMNVSARVLKVKRNILEVESTVVQAGETCADAVVKIFQLA